MFLDYNLKLSINEVSTNSSLNYHDCFDFQNNGGIVHLQCSNFLNKETTAKRCDGIFTRLNMYGATMIVFANIVYLIMYAIVDLLYILVPGIRQRAYDKAVLCFSNIQAALSITVITLGHFMLCHKQLSKLAYSLFGITLMIFTISGVLWLLVISFDVSSTITRLHWAPSSGAKGQDENHKFKVYFLWVLVGTIIPVTISTVLEFSPLPDDHFAKPNFYSLNDVNYRVIVHVIYVPIIVAFMSNVLFFYTTAKMISIQKSTSVVNENRKVKAKYILYLQLYLLMDAPYITGALGSIYENLWILKFVRTVQPALMMYAVLPKNITSDIFFCKKKKKSERKIVKQKNVQVQL